MDTQDDTGEQGYNGTRRKGDTQTQETQGNMKTHKGAGQHDYKKTHWKNRNRHRATWDHSYRVTHRITYVGQQRHVATWDTKGHTR